MGKPEWVREGVEASYLKRRGEMHGQMLASMERKFGRKGWGELPAQVRQAFMLVPRHWYVYHDELPWVYSDDILPLNIDQSATASQPSMMALMIKLLLGKNGGNELRSCLDVGSGSGYGSALLHETGFRQVLAVEVDEGLAERSRRALDADGRLVDGAEESGVRVVCGDIRELENEGKFDAINVGVMLGEEDELDRLTAMLGVGGSFVAPASVDLLQCLSPASRIRKKGQLVDGMLGNLIRAEKIGEGDDEVNLYLTNVDVRFVKLKTR